MIKLGNTNLEEAYNILIGEIQALKVFIGNLLVWDNIETGGTLLVAGPSTLSGESATFVPVYNNNYISGGTWSIVSGSSYGSISSSGELTLNSLADNSEITIQCTYLGTTALKTITCTYIAGITSETTTETITNAKGQTIETITVVNEDGQGNTSTSTTEIIHSQDNSYLITTSETTENIDGSGTYRANIISYDDSGNITGTTTQTQTTNSDGSYSGNTTNYDENGDPTDGENIEGDTSGNINTQNLIYDSNGNAVVVNYNIDTSENPNGTKTYNLDGVNTDYYAFDVTRGFILDFDFVIDFTKQPSGQNEGHHNILTVKRDSPSPWYGFLLRQSNTNKYIQLGTQFSTGSNTNTTLNASTVISGNVYEYNLLIIYDPTANSNNFICKDASSGTILYSSNSIFPDIEELKYLKVVIGYSVQADGTHYRYSNIDVKNFQIQRIPLVETPSISCDGEHITLSCATTGADIYYRLHQTGSYKEYTGTLAINTDTVIETYAELNGEKSFTAKETCLYDNGIERPTISSDGETITITCDTPSVTIYYRLNQTGEFHEYTEAIEINDDVIIEAYSELNGEIGPTVTLSCSYNPIILNAPIINNGGSLVAITCSTVGASIYYRLGQSGLYALYSGPIAISEDTIVQAFATIGGKISPVVTENCIYSLDYSKEYLTFNITSSGTIAWKSIGSGQAKTIEYSLNNGTWTSITAESNPGVTISVVNGDSIRFRGTNTSYAKDKSNYSGFDGGTALFNIKGNIMSLIYGDNFENVTTFNGGTYNFCSLFKQSNVVSAEHLILSATTLTNYCYRALFSKCASLSKAPALPATTLAQGVYWYMFEECPITIAPDLPAETLVSECYGHMFLGCTSLNYIKCSATGGLSATKCLEGWTASVASSGIFIKASNATWTTGTNGIPTNWTVYNDTVVSTPEISYDGFDTITITCATQGATVYYRLNQTGNYLTYSTPITISSDTIIESYSELGGQTSRTISKECEYISTVPLEASSRNIKKWQYSGQEITTPYSVNAIDGHSSSYLKGTFNFETDVILRELLPTYLWFLHADQSAVIYVDDVQVTKHWGGYTAFTIDISNYVHAGVNHVKVALKNNEGNYLAPAAGDFNFNATLGNVRVLTSPCLPTINYGYDGFHISSTVTSASATVNVKTTVPSGASVVCTIDDGTYTWTDTQISDGTEITFTDIISNPHLWNGTLDPHLYNITLEIYKDNILYHRFTRPYGLRFYEYVINDTTKYGSVGNPYTGFLLNGQPYLLRGVCMHDDIIGKANALNDTDYNNTFATIQELGCNFIRLAHYPHPKEVYDRCDALGIIVQTEGPCVNKLQSTMPADYYDHLNTLYDDMVNQHYNHPCIMFWGLSNETTTDDKEFGKAKIEGYVSRIKALDSERLVGYVMSHSYDDPFGYYNDPTGIDWVGGNIYVGWYIDLNSNNPSNRINDRITKTITNKNKALAYSEYGCGGTPECHSDNFMTTTTRGNNARHDIEYQMWLHEGHIAAIKNYPLLMFTAQWQLFDIAVANRNEGYTVCLDGETTSTDDNLRRLNNKGLVQRDHVTKKDTFYLYKAWWNPTPFIHICGKNYTKRASRVIKCYTNVSNDVSLYVNNVLVETVTPANYIVQFTERTFNEGDIIKVSYGNIDDSFTI